MTTTDFDRNQTLRQALQPAAGCPPLGELLDTLLAQSASPRAAELRAHAGECSACAAELTLARAFDAAPKSAEEAQDIAWVAAQLQLPAAASAVAALTPQLARVLPMAPHAAKRARLARQAAGTPLWTRWAAAALVIVGLGLVFEWGHRSFAPALPDRSDALSSDVVRSGEVRLDSPVGVVEVVGMDSLPTFAWRPVTGAASYRIDVRDVADDLLWQGSVVAPSLVAPPELRAKLETLVTYRWHVTAFDAAQSAIGHSATATFRVEPPTN
ncbi:MAG: hypothetical protein ABI689_10065 [Thermoanaerobaculia bacterium]